MADGYWANSHWASGYWGSGYWSQGGTAPPVAPTAAPTLGKPRRKEEFPSTIEDVGLLIMLISSLRRQRENANNNSS